MLCVETKDAGFIKHLLYSALHWPLLMALHLHKSPIRKMTLACSNLGDAGFGASSLNVCFPARLTVESGGGHGDWEKE